MIIPAIRLMRPTPWRISGSSGMSVSVGTPVVEVSAGGHYLRLPIYNEDTGESVLLQGGGLGPGLGVSLTPSPFDVAGSPDDAPAGGIGRIWGSPLAPNPMQREDFEGAAYIRTGSGGALFGLTGGGSIIAFAPLGLLPLVKAIGAFWSTGLDTDKIAVGADANVVGYWIWATDP